MNGNLILASLTVLCSFDRFVPDKLGFYCEHIFNRCTELSLLQTRSKQNWHFKNIYLDEISNVTGSIEKTKTEDLICNPWDENYVGCDYWTKHLMNNSRFKVWKGQKNRRKLEQTRNDATNQSVEVDYNCIISIHSNTCYRWSWTTSSKRSIIRGCNTDPTWTKLNHHVTR